MKRLIIVSLVLFLTGFSQLYPSQPENQENDSALLREILDKSAVYCEELKKMAFNFFCNEGISEKTYSFKKRIANKGNATSLDLVPTETLEVSKIKTKKYRYDYQMVKEGDRMSEKRNLLDKKGRLDRKKDKPALERFLAKYLVFGPVGFLSQSWQAFFNYKIMGREKIDGRKAIIISAAPISPRAENYYFGKIWIDEQDHSILKLEWDPESLENYSDKVTTSFGDLKRKVAWMVQYGVEKNGIRFPSLQHIREILVDPAEKEHVKYEAVVKYENYKFFNISMDVKYRKDL